MTALLCRLAPTFVFFFFIPNRFVSVGLRLAILVSITFCVFPAEFVDFALGRKPVTVLTYSEVASNLAWGLAVMLSVSLPTLALYIFCCWISRLSVLEKRYSQLLARRQAPLALSNLLSLLFICILLYSGVTEVFIWTLVSTIEHGSFVAGEPSKEGFILLSRSFLMASYFLFPIALAYLSFYFGTLLFERLFSNAELVSTLASFAEFLLALCLLVVTTTYSASIAELLTQLDIGEYLRQRLLQGFSTT